MKVGELPFQGAGFVVCNNTHGAASLALGYAWIAPSGRFSSIQTKTKIFRIRLVSNKMIGY